MIRIPLFETARIGCIGNLEIYIRTDDPDNIPHFHIWDKETMGRKFHGCIRIDKAEYCFQESKRSTLNSEQLGELVKFLESPYERYGITNWDRVVIAWNDNNSKANLPDDYPMPNYLEMRG